MDYKKEILFNGGKLEICPAGEYTDSVTGEKKKSIAKVRLNNVVDKWGNVSPGVFLEMLKAVTKDSENIALLEKIK